MYVCFTNYSHDYARDNDLSTFNGVDKHYVLKNKTVEEVIQYCKNNNYKCFVRGGKEQKSRYYIKRERSLRNLKQAYDFFKWSVKKEHMIKRHKNHTTFFIIED